MKTQINIAELLEGCPKGMKLYSPLCGECYFDRLNFGTIICKKQNTQEITFTSRGYYMLPVFDDCECMIFPSKDQRDWSKFVPPYKFKDGDVLFVDCSDDEEDKSYQYIFILNKPEFLGKWHSYCMLDGVGNFQLHETYLTDEEYHPRFATEEEKQKLFDAIKSHGYKWNSETKTLEKLIEPKFNVGDKVKHKVVNKNDVYEINRVYDDSYGFVGFPYKIPMKHQDKFELVPNKFDITTLKPFDRVLMRSSNAREWVATFYSHYSNNKFYGCGMCCDQCIPYDGNEHLLGTTNDCDEYFKNW